MVTINAMAKKWGIGNKEHVVIEKTSGGIFVNGQKVKEVMFNNIQLRFVMPDKSHFLLFDGRTESNLSIKEMYNQLK